ncbi:MAG: serine/threonine protein kinase [Planctomycetaceae bacterium]|nr:serine/threonine protein kinase [Planctomycetaceae bacterium]
MKAELCGDDALELILKDQQQHPDFDSAVAHLSACTRCQQRLDDLSAHPVWWRNVRRHLVNVEETIIPELPDATSLVTAQVDDTGLMPSVPVDSFLDPASHPEMLGRIGKYDIEREIGRGGMGIVLKGFDSELNRPVAIKLLSPHLASSGIARQRFIREARAAAAVVHENVVAIHGIETQGTLPSIVMPFVSGQSLQQHIDAHGPLETVDVVRIGVQVASGLAAAHEQGLVHRDIKPANIMLENSINRVQITDFGLARAAHDANLTRSGIIAGTPSFMAPEQALSESVDHRADLFSLGSVLYFAATGVLPFRASTPIGVMQQVCEARPQRVRSLNPQVPEVLETVIEKLQASSAEDRFQSAQELQKYLSDYLGHLQQPTSRKPPRKLYSPAARKRRQKVVRITAGTCLTAAVALLLAVAVFRPGWVGKGWWNVAPAVAPATVAVIPLSQLDDEIDRLEHDISQLEQQSITPSGSTRWLPQQQSQELSGVHSDVGRLETNLAPQSADAMDAWMDHEIESLARAIRQLRESSATTSY